MLKEGFGVESSPMSEGRGGVEGGYQSVTSFRWDVHPALVVQVSVFICPVFYGGTREQRDVSA